MFCPDGDLIGLCSHHLPVLPLLFVFYQSSLVEYVVEKDLDNDIVAGVDFTSRLSAATYDVFRVQMLSSPATPTLGFRFLPSDQLLSSPNTLEIYLDFPDPLQRLLSAFQS